MISASEEFYEMPEDPRVFIEQSMEGLRTQTSAHAATWHLGEEAKFAVDQDTGRIRFTFKDGKIAEADIQIVGTYDKSDGTFLWGWDHPSVAEPLREHANLTRRFGEAYGLGKYLERKATCSEDEAWEFTAVAARLGKANGAYRCRTGGALVYLTFGEITLSRGTMASQAPAPVAAGPAMLTAEPIEATMATPNGAATPTVMWPRLERLLDSLSDRLNPILVKEARQAMKSKQFSVTFALLLIVGWVYTLLFVVLNLPGVFYSPLGSAMLFGYYLILAVPLLIVVPYASFRSLAAELEDGTFDLLSITALGARDIVLGKLGSSVLQMIVYYSALAPCIAFTYLLRGIDVVTIALLLTYTFLASLLLSILALTLSTVTRARHWQVLLSVLLVIALLLFGFFWCMTMISMLATASMLPYDQTEWWMFNVAVLTFYVPLSILFILIAAGQVTFASENRSTGVRIVLLVLQTLIVGWTIYGFLKVEEEEILMVGAGFIGGLWAVAGAFLIGEMAQLSPRARRELPQSLLGRMAFTWFNPGSGTGYVFAIASALGAMLTLFVTGLTASFNMGTGGLTRLDHWTAWWLAILSYLTIYLGTARLLGVAMRKAKMGGGMLGTFVSYILLLVMGIFLPLSLQSFINWIGEYNFGNFEYTMLQLPNWFWTLLEIGENRLVISDGSIWILMITAAIVFLLNFVLAAKEVEQTRIAAPTRVLQDEAELHPPPKPAKRNPWDDAPGEPAPTTTS